MWHIYIARDNNGQRNKLRLSYKFQWNYISTPDRPGKVAGKVARDIAMTRKPNYYGRAARRGRLEAREHFPHNKNWVEKGPEAPGPRPATRGSSLLTPLVFGF